MTPTAAGADTVIDYGTINDTDGTPVSGAPDAADVDVTPVNHARDDGTANSDTLDAVYGDDSRFRIGGDLNTHDSNDRFLNAGKVVGMANI